MTAKEIKEQHLTYPYSEGEYKNVPFYSFTPYDMQAFIDQLCREQREICSRIYEFETLDCMSETYEHIREDIENAPTPEL